MKKLFIDSNIWLRFFVKDNTMQYAHVFSLMSSIESGNFRVYTSAIVLLEVYFVLIKLYNVSHKEALETLQTILKVRGITLIEKVDARQAIEISLKYNLKLSDSYIASQVTTEMILVTYDKDFIRVNNVKVATPQGIR